MDLSSCGSDPWWWPPLSSYLCSVMFTTKQSWRANAPSYIVGGGRWESGSLWWVRGWNPRCSLVLASLQFGVRNTNTHMWSCSQRVFAATKTADENRFDVSPAQMFTDEVILCFYVVHQLSESLRTPNVTLSKLVDSFGFVHNSVTYLAKVQWYDIQ